jgi:hypothetical protein
MVYFVLKCAWVELLELVYEFVVHIIQLAFQWDLT